MYSLKGFINIGLLTDNTVGVVAPLGELSTRSRTYSREIGGYVHSSAPDVKLITFSSKRQNVGLVPVSNEYAQHVLAVAQWVYNEAIAGAITNNAAQFLSAIGAEFEATAEGFSCGEMVTDGRYWMPEYLLWSFKGAGEENYLKIWFSDAAFQRQYDEYEIIVVPPVHNLDDLFQDKETVEAKLRESDTLDKLMDRVAEATGGEPYTYLRTIKIDWHDQFNPDNVLPTHWTVAIYGKAGDTIDNIKRALMEYVLENSNRPRDDWVVILPDLFRVTEFIIVPLWHQYSVPNQTLVAGIYSPVGRIRDLVTKALPYCKGYEEAHVARMACYTTFVYKSLGLVIVPGPENREAVSSFEQTFPDYMTIPTTHLDFNRMSPRTQNWVLLMYEMLKQAETMTEFSDLPIGLGRLKREGVLYVTATYEDVNYLVVAKSNPAEW